MKDILFLGGSTGLTLHQTFPEIFFNSNTKDYNYINLSISGAGNFYITGSFFEYINKHKKPDYVFFKFTGLNRLDLPFDTKVKLTNYSFQSIGNEGNGSSFIKINKNWVCSGGYAGSWLGEGILKKIFCYMYDVKDQNSTNEQSLQQIFTCISLCETLNIPYNWTFYYDVINPPSKSSKQDGYIGSLPEYISKKQMLNFSPLNFAYSVNEAPDDGNHYSKRVFKKYLTQEIIYNKIRNTIKNI